MLRTASSLPPQGLLTLGFDPARFQVKPPACYRAWPPGSYPDQLSPAGDDQLTNTKIHHGSTSRCHLPFCWAHERCRLMAIGAA